jgi:4-alpha-glucanotransferase
MADPIAWGIDPGYHDVRGDWHPTTLETAAALLSAMGASPGQPPPPIGNDVWVVRQWDRVNAGGFYTLTCEDGSQHRGLGFLPTDLPLGYHELRLHQRGTDVRLIVSPRACQRVSRRSWGWAAQLYALRSACSWGMGDLVDLANLASWSASLGARALLVNPLHAPLPTPSQQPSPYYPSSRCFRNPLYLRVEAVEGAADVAAVEQLAAAGRALSSSDLIDRDAVWRVKREALEAVFARWEASGRDGPLGAYAAEIGPILSRYAAFCALVEVHGPTWRQWPEPLRDPVRAEAAVAAEPALSRRARFHSWLQWQLDRQLSEAGQQGVDLIQDLAVGCDPAGADVWLWKDAFADGVRVGAPPDEFAPGGQDWGLPPFDPWRLRKAAFEPFVEIVRAAFRHGGGVRIDHVMGLFRLFWIPPDALPSAGAYVRYPWEELLDIVALESARSGGFVVGEDLGTVEPWVRESLAQRNVLSYRLLWFEDEEPASWPSNSLGAVTTHDLPTVAGAVTGADAEDQRAAGVEPDTDLLDALAARVDGGAADVEAAIVSAHRMLAESPSVIRLASLEDAVAELRRPNLPGTVDERPNWRIPLSVTLEGLGDHPLVAQLVRILQTNDSRTSGLNPPDPGYGAAE